jgi:hypothetical protein
MIRVFPRQTKWTPTDSNAFVGDPPLFRPSEQSVKISVTFNWDIEEGRRLLYEWSRFYEDVQVGGPAFNDPGDEFEPGRFIKKGVTITSRGCIKHCPWCFVWDREGPIRELQIKPGWIVQDNNLLACSKKHIETVFEMLIEQNRNVIFSGGLDIYLLREWHLKLIEKIKIEELWFACDTSKHIERLGYVSTMLNGIPINKKRCYTMIGFNGETLLQAEKRLEVVYSLGFLPFAQLYRGQGEQKYTDAWKALARKYSRPAAYRSNKDRAKGMF